MSTARLRQLTEMLCRLSHAADAADVFHAADGGTVVKTRSCAGGSIHTAEVATLDDGRQFFVKSSPAAAEMFKQESFGLELLRRAGTLRIPEVRGVGMLGNGLACLVLEYIPSGAPQPGSYEQLGRRLADLHRVARADRFGLDSDNFIGATPQPNGWLQSWTDFFGQRRLGYQIELLKKAQPKAAAHLQSVERLIARLPDILEDPVQASLLHGDLWSGNLLIDGEANPVLIDPAVYYGHREADLAMMQLFGGFPAQCWAAYQEAWPLSDQWLERIEIYKLYHLLNHVNLFGTSYVDACLRILRRFV